MVPEPGHLEEGEGAYHSGRRALSELHASEEALVGSGPCIRGLVQRDDESLQAQEAEVGAAPRLGRRRHGVGDEDGAREQENARLPGVALQEFAQFRIEAETRQPGLDDVRPSSV